MAKTRVVMTGAAGRIGQRMLEPLRERYDLVLLDAAERTRDGAPVEGLIACDLTNPDRDAYRAHFRGAQAVVHLAWRSAPGMTWEENAEALFRNEHANIAMAYNVYQTCLEEGVRRVVVASSNHATDFYERLMWAGGHETVSEKTYPHSDNYYGWAKIAYEELGFVFATGQVGGRALEVVQVRIGAPRESILERCEPGEVRKMVRGLGMYLSARDQVQLFTRCIDTERIENEHGVPFQVVYGISGNSHNYWSIANARKVFAYAPQDDSAVLFADRIAEICRGDVAAMNPRWDGRQQP